MFKMLESRYDKTDGFWKYHDENGGFQVGHATKKQFEEEKSALHKLCKPLSEEYIRHFGLTEYHICTDRDKIVSLIKELQKRGYVFSMNDEERQTIILECTAYSHAMRCRYYHQLKVKYAKPWGQYQFLWESSFYFPKNRRVKFGSKYLPLRRYTESPFGLGSTCKL
ncbi:hypothetical protein QCQ60_005120 [Bacillus cereus]|nr:hypothetical protein [Bacillus cereus]